MHLLRLKIHGNTVQVPEDFVDERFRLASLLHHEMAPTFLGNLDERIASHVLDTFMGLVHELKKLVDDSLQELPMRLQESGVLADDVPIDGGR